MRNKIIKLLRNLQQRSSYENEYEDFSVGYMCNYYITDTLDFPDYRLIITKLNEKYKKSNNKQKNLLADNNIRAELKRMEADELITISIQKGIRNATTDKNGPDVENKAFTTECIILTTQGKDRWRYYYHKAKENPFVIFISITSLIISIIALTK